MSNTGTFSGSLTGDPVLKFLDSGKAVTNFSLRVVTGKRTEGSEYAPCFFIDVAVWNGDNNNLAENVAESLVDKDRVLVTGKLVADSWEDKETGAKRTKLKLTAYEVALDLTYATATVKSNERSGGGQNRAPRQQAAQEPAW